MERILEQQNLEILECALQTELEEVWSLSEKETPYVPHYIQGIDRLIARLRRVRKILCSL